MMQRDITRSQTKGIKKLVFYKQKSLCYSAEDKKFLWYHLSSPPQGASWDPNRSAGCIGPYPSSPTWISAKPLRKVFHIPAPAALHQPAVLWRNFLDMYWFSSTCYRYVLPSLALYPAQVNTQKTKRICSFDTFFLCHLSSSRKHLFFREKFFPDIDPF